MHRRGTEGAENNMMNKMTDWAICPHDLLHKLSNCRSRFISRHPNVDFGKSTYRRLDKNSLLYHDLLDCDPKTQIIVDLRINETLQTGAVANRTYRAWGKYRITELFADAHVKN